LEQRENVADRSIANDLVLTRVLDKEHREMAKIAEQILFFWPKRNPLTRFREAKKAKYAREIAIFPVPYPKLALFKVKPQIVIAKSVFGKFCHFFRIQVLCKISFDISRLDQILHIRHHPYLF
jgi:hypothetical protein